MGKVLTFIYDEMADFEVTLANQFINQFTEHEVKTVGFTKELKKGRSGMVYKPDLTVLEALNEDGIEGLIIPGGQNDEHREELTTLIEKLKSDNKLLAAICWGPRFLSRTSALDGIKYTTTYKREEGVEDSFNWENFSDEGVVVDKNIITAKGNFFVDFSVEILDYYDPCDKEIYKIETKNYYKGILN